MVDFWDDEPPDPPKGRSVPVGAWKETIRVRPKTLPEAAGRDPKFPDVPPFDTRLADELALMLDTGLTAIEAVQYLVPGVNLDIVPQLARTWSMHPLMPPAISRLHGGDWHKLTPDQRIEVGTKKHLAELARFLINNKFEDATGADLSKMNIARDVLLKVTGEIDPSDPLAVFLARTAKGIMEKAVAQTPAQHAGSHVDFRAKDELDEEIH